MKVILTPIDFSGITQRVVDVAADLARALHGRVVLLHVIRAPQVVTAYELEIENLSELTSAMEGAADEELAELSRALQGMLVDVEVARVTAYPAAGIVEQGKKLSADYIVIGSHGHTPFYDLI